MRLVLTAGMTAFLLAGSAFAQPTTDTAPVVQPSPGAVDNTITTRDTANPPVVIENHSQTTPVVPSVTSNIKAPSNPAVKTTEGNNPGAPIAGANSFTEGQAKARIESRGYTNVSTLIKDTQGIWRGKGDKEGKTFEISLDYQGNVVSR